MNKLQYTNNNLLRLNMWKALSLVAITLFITVNSSGDDHQPTLYIIGDSTVKHGSGKGNDGLWGWGDLIGKYFDTSEINVENHARGGRSSRTFRTEGLWDQVLANLQPGDFVLMQFGHNDGGSLNTGRARGSLKGNGDETKKVMMEATSKPEVVHTYGWYIRQYIKDTKAKGAIPVVVSQIPRNIWHDGKVERASNDYGKWAKESAEAEGAYFIDLNKIVAKRYEEEGEEKVKTAYFLEDHTHTTEAGAHINAAAVIEGLQMIEECPLNDYLSDAAAEMNNKQ